MPPESKYQVLVMRKTGCFYLPECVARRETGHGAGFRVKQARFEHFAKSTMFPGLHDTGTRHGAWHECCVGAWCGALCTTWE